MAFIKKFFQTLRNVNYISDLQSKSRAERRKAKRLLKKL